MIAAKTFVQGTAIDIRDECATQYFNMHCWFIKTYLGNRQIYDVFVLETLCDKETKGDI